jgi:glycosyltransferase involved in cell wall biosynthesis
MKFNILIIVDKPNFYKINLFNEINKVTKICVVYVGEENIKRDDLFYSGSMNYNYYLLSGNKIKKLIYLVKIILQNKFNKIMLGGWDNIYYIFILLAFKTSIIVESTELDKKRIGFVSNIKFFLKKIILFRVEKFQCAGYRHAKYMKSFHINKKIVISKTVGFPFDHTLIDRLDPSLRKNFVFIGRNSPEKNIKFMIDVFNRSLLSKDDKLILVGDAFLEYKNELNVQIIPQITRDNMAEFLMSFRALILLSRSEPYGLVVEEALRCGIPVIVSDRCGIVDTLVFDAENSIVVNINNPDNVISKLNTFFKLEKVLVDNINKINFKELDQKSLRSFFE